MRRHHRAHAAVPLLVLSALPLSACGNEPDPDPAARAQPPATAGHANVVPAGYDGRFRFVGTVLESSAHGPQLCTFVAESYPPQCGGPDVVGWDWGGVDAESASGTTWGDYVLVGHWDGTRFTLTRPPREARDRDWGKASLDADLTSPCPEPDGGWHVIDASKATEEALDATQGRASRMRGYAGSWFHHLRGERDPAAREHRLNPPARFVLNLRFTDDLATRERELRETWGGALCVSRAERTEKELHRIQRELEGRAEFVSSAQDELANAVDFGVWVAHAELVADIEDRYGRGAVRVFGVLAPIDL